MARRIMTVARFEDIKRLILQGQKDRAIARTLHCSRDKVAEIRRGEATNPSRPRAISGPLWAEQVPWPEVVTELSMGHPLKFIWEEKAQSLTTYSNFWKQFYRKHPQLLKASVTLREFAPGERCEVDYAGDKIPWIDLRTGTRHEAAVFIGALGFSQLLFAWASEDMKSRNWLASHRRMFEAFGGVPHVTVPDCLKQGVLKCHLYDPDLNPSYSELAAFYQTAIVPARPMHPKDKSIVEGAVKILMRYFKWIYRKRTFTSIGDINQALAETVVRVNSKTHTRFRVSRLERWEKMDRSALKPLPVSSYDTLEWKTAKLHPDCYISVEGAYYTAPHIHRGKTLRVKLTENHVELFLNLERVALHNRDRNKCGNRVKNIDHLPENSKAYHEATPQHLLSQSRFIHASLYTCVEELFSQDTLGNLRRVQGLIRSAVKEINETSADIARPRIQLAIEAMHRFQKFRVSYFQEILKDLRRKPAQPEGREINRLPNNPMIRYRASSGGSESITTELNGEE